MRDTSRQTLPQLSRGQPWLLVRSWRPPEGWPATRLDGVLAMDSRVTHGETSSMPRSLQSGTPRTACRFRLCVAHGSLRPGLSARMSLSRPLAPIVAVRPAAYFLIIAANEPDFLKADQRPPW